MRASTWRVSITGAAVRSPLGNSLTALRTGLLRGEPALTRDHPYRNLIDAPLGILTETRDRGEGRAAELTRQLAHDLIEAAPHLRHYAPHDIGLFLGTTTSGAEHWLNVAQVAKNRDATWRATPAHLLHPNYELASVAPLLKHALSIKGPAFVFATACSASAVALAKARDALRLGLVKAAVAGGFDVLTPMTIMGFDALQILSHDLCRPFHPDRRGLNLAEGGALFLLEHARTRDAKLGDLVGVGAACDAHHMTHPDPEARGMESAMRRALDDARLAPADIAYVNAHGTGTLANDHTERMALDRVFGENGVAFSSTKNLHGHTLGGAGALEAAVCLALMPTTPRHFTLSNSFGFGGNNATLVFETPA